ncbi:DUF4157 domain-containing protein [Streptomyces griseoluteus]|uniref:eCIS core domain-containing protein n=1 Tax=Streptomyces griseoluteus TaxID=29306 RepID=UPI0033EDA0D9
MQANDSARNNEAENSRSSARTPSGRAATPIPALLALQSSAGNAAVVQMLRRAGHAGAQDRHQHSAGCGHQQVEQPVQRSTVPDVLRSPGRPLDDDTRTEMEARLGADFSDVRIHTDTAAHRSAAELGARAYTSGSHVVVGPGGGDRHTLAHELTHVIQQRSGPVSSTPTSDGVSVSDPRDRFERAAEANARRVMAGPAPTAHDHAPVGHGRTIDTRDGREAVIQRMTMTEFDQLLAPHNLVGDPDFQAYFEIKRGQDNPQTIVNNFPPAAAGSQTRFQQFVADPTLTAQDVTQYINSYQHLTPQARAQPAVLDDAELAGLEVELPWVRLNVPPGTGNGELLGASTATTEPGPPVIKLETEGTDRGSPTIELIYGPLPRTEYRSPALIEARGALVTALRPAGPLKELLKSYNARLNTPELERYKITIDGRSDTMRKVTVTKAQEEPSNPSNSNTQTNVSTPYTKLGTAADQNPEEDFTNFFENQSGHEATMFREARTRAAGIQTQIDSHWNTNHANAGRLTSGSTLTSLLTHLLYQEGMYINHRLDRTQIRDADKHHFHVMLKASPQDAVMSIISDDEAKMLLAWLVNTNATPLGAAAVATFASLRTGRQAPSPTRHMYRYLVNVLVARLVAGRQLLEVKRGAQQRWSETRGDAHGVGQVAHVHPRPSNRLPITIQGTEYYIVVEQRSAKHSLNRNALADPSAAVGQIGDLQHT